MIKGELSLVVDQGLGARADRVHRLGRRRRQGQPQGRVLRLGVVLLLLHRGLRRRRDRRLADPVGAPAAAADRQGLADRPPRLHDRPGRHRGAGSGADRVARHRAGHRVQASCGRRSGGQRVRPRLGTRGTGVVGHHGDEVRLSPDRRRDRARRGWRAGRAAGLRLVAAHLAPGDPRPTATWRSASPRGCSWRCCRGTRRLGPTGSPTVERAPTPIPPTCRVASAIRPPGPPRTAPWARPPCARASTR